MASTKGLVPITKAFLSKFYDGYPFENIRPEVKQSEKKLAAVSKEMDAQRTKDAGDDGLLEKLTFTPPHKIDENLWKNREQLEEILFLLEKDHWPASVVSGETELSKSLGEATVRWFEQISKLLDSVRVYQRDTSDKVSEMVFTYLPQDFRGTLIKQQKERSEKKRQLELETLLSSGGSIEQKYALMWQQQMDRRKTLAALGAASGVYRTLVSFLVGVPQVLLDFVRQINDHNGPMEEQRTRYGPHLYTLTAFVNRLRIFLCMWWKVFEEQTEKGGELIAMMDEAVTLYCSEFLRFLTTLRQLFENAPFLISADDAMSVEDKEKLAQFKEVTVANGSKHEVELEVEMEGSVVAWDFQLTLGKGIVPYSRLEANQGSFNSPGVGKYSFVFDNSYSYLNKKSLRYKIDAIPPVMTEEEDALEEKLANANLNSEEKEEEGDGTTA